MQFRHRNNDNLYLGISKASPEARNGISTFFPKYGIFWILLPLTVNLENVVQKISETWFLIFGFISILITKPFCHMSFIYFYNKKKSFHNITFVALMNLSSSSWVNAEIDAMQKQDIVLTL